MLRVELVHRQELVEHVVVEHQQHRLVRRVVLYAEEALRGVVRLHVVHTVALYDVLVLRAVGCERYATMEEHLKVGPHLVEALLARQLEHAHQHAEHPRGHARYVRHVLVQTLAGDAVALHLEVAEQRGLLLRHTHEVHKRVDVLDENGAEVAHERACHVVVGRVRTA